ncbi:MAG: DEAD/DEAH box helicase, partial [Spirochaetales bacterium]|nr:DEAD/DEAH box helicase [Spirochaetales bacterium]
FRSFFEGQCEIELGPDRIPLNLALKLYEENNYIPLTDGTKAIVEKKFFDKLIRILGKTDKENRVKLSFFDLPLVDMIIEEKTEEKGFVKYREIFEGFNKINSRRLKKDLIQGELRDYQKYGVKWFNYLKENRLGGCLADDMGLGKTVQTISLLTADYKQNEAAPSSLIIMPRSLLTNWQRELEKFAPQLSVCLYYGPERNLAEALKHQIILTTYSLVRNDIEQLHGTPFRFLILDEIQAIKNIHSRIAKAVMLLEGTYRFGLSGTPMENHVGEIYSIFRFLNPTMFGSLNDFSRRYLNPIQKKNDPHAAELLGKKLSPFILRRLKQDVASELPPRTEQILYAEMDKDQAALYEDRRHFYEQTIKSAIGTEGFAKAGFMILQGLLELRQLASIPEIKTEGKIVSPKWSVFLDHMAEVIEGGHRCLVFTNFLSTVEILSQKLEEKGIDHLVMTGSTTNRAELVDRFQSSQRQKVFLMTLKTGGVGLNLTGADYVYILDPWWNRSAEQQAIDRTHRIGQTKSIFSYRVISRGTIEEKILQLQERKKQLFSSLISSDGQLMKKLTEEDIDFLLNDRSAL